MSLLHDLRDSWRVLARSPQFTIPVVLSLALAVGGNVAAFSVVNSLVFRSLPISAPDRMFYLTYAGQSARAEGGNYAWFEMVRDRARTVQSAFVDHRRGNVNVVVDGQIEAVTGSLVSGGYFTALGAVPQIGRLIVPADETGSTSKPVVVLSDGFWSRRFARDPTVVGRTIRVNNKPLEVIGVAQPEYTGLELGRRIDLYAPIDAAEYHKGWVSMVVGVRLADNASEVSAAEELTLLLQEFAKSMPPARARARFERVQLVSLTHGVQTQGGVRDRYVTPALAVWFIIGTMMLLACANWAMLLLARASARAREMSIRLALGSTRFELTRRNVVESVSLALLSGGFGLLAAWWGLRWLPGNGLPVDLVIEPDLKVFGFATLLTTTTGMLFALGPALLIGRIRPNDLRGDGRTHTSHMTRVGRGLVAVQVALSLGLVVTAGLFAATLRNLRGQPLGFSQERVITFSLDADGTGIEGEALVAMHRRVLAHVRSMPGVRAATLATVSPLSGNEDGKTISIPGFVAQSPDDLNAQVNTVGPEFFETFGIPILKGRAIAEEDAEKAAHVALVSESAARYYFPGLDPIGRSLEIKGSTVLRPVIIGIVPDVMYGDLRTPTERMFYVPFYQRFAEGEYDFAVRADGNVDRLIRQLPSELNTIAPMPMLGLRTLEQQVDARMAHERLLGAMSGFFGILAVVLAGVGIYGIVAYAASRRAKELAVRVALGAARRHIVWQLIKGGLAVVTIGVALGLVPAVAAGNRLTGLLFGVEPTTPVVYLSAAAVLCIVSALATVTPVARALRSDPVRGLQSE